MSQAERMSRDGGEEIKAAGTVFRSVKVEEVSTITTDFVNNTKKHNMEIVSRPTVAWSFDLAPNEPNFPLDKYAVEIRSEPNIVAVRICESLKKRSVVAVYKDATALCTTSSQLKYAIYLYASLGETTKLEVLRHDGCGFQFRTEREAVINAAYGHGPVAPSSLPFQMKIPEEYLANYKPPEQTEQEKMLSRAVDRLHSDRLDQKLFIFQNLAAITCCDTVNNDAASQMSELILKDTHEILSMIKTFLNQFQQNEEDDDMKYQILNACLSIIANSMDSLSEYKSLQTILSKSNAYFILQEISCSLVKIVHDCTCPHNTTLALNCFRLILENSSAANEFVNETTCRSIKAAEEIGNRTHQNLFLAAKSTLAACNKEVA